jgi:LacI family transcriptional regulator
MVDADGNLVSLVGGEPSFFIYYSQFASTFTHSLGEMGYQVRIETYNDDIVQFNLIMERISMQPVVGIALNPPDRFEVGPAIDHLRAIRVVVVLIGRKIAYPNVDYVGADNEGIGYQATRHLIQLGHTRIAYVGNATGATGHDRVTGFIRAMHEAGLPPLQYFGPAVNNLVLPAWFTAFRDPDDHPLPILKAIQNREITAAFCYNDGTAVWVQNQIRSVNLSVPRDISLVSVDNLPFFQFLDAPLTTFALPGEEVGRQAADLMLRRLAGEDFPPQQVLLPAHFVQRLSTASPRD